MFQRFKDIFSKRSYVPVASIRDVFDSTMSTAGVEINVNNALQVSAVSACVRLLADSVASLPLHVYRRSGVDKELASDHSLYPLLALRPNPFQTSFVWRQHIVANVLLHGNAYSIIERDSKTGQVSALWPTDPRVVNIRRALNGVEYEIIPPSGRMVFPMEDILHFRGFTLDGFTGISVLSMARQGIGLDAAMLTHGGSLFKNSARPGLILSTPETYKPETRAKLLEYFKETVTGSLNAGKTVVLEGGMKAEPFGFSAEDAQFLGSRAFSVQEIARFFRVPPHMIGDNTRLAYASSETEMNAFIMHSLRPWLENLEAEIAVKLFGNSNRFFAEFDANALTRGDQAARYEAYGKGLAAGWLTVADVRRAENLPFIEGTDNLLTPANMLPQSPAR